MKRKGTVGLSVLGAWSLLIVGAKAEIRTVTYQKWDDCVELTNGAARIIVAPSAGGRVVHYNRDNGPNFFLGGYQIDIGPELEYPPAHQPLWSGRYEVEKIGPLSVRLISPKDEATGVQIVKVLELAESGAGLVVRQMMKNVGSKEIAYCLWDRTLTGATYGLFELNPKSRFPARWSIRQGESRSYRYDGASPSSPRVKIIGDLLITVPGKKMEKVGADSVAGWIAGFRDGWLYVKQFPVYPNADYADGGNSVEFWVDPAGTRTEIEPLSPKVRLQPGESYSFDERWDLQRVEETIVGADDIPKLLPTIRKMAQLPKGSADDKTSSDAARPAPLGVFAKPNLVAWCIVPFDVKKRGPEERAQMLKRLGISRFAYDYRAEHIPTFDQEMQMLKKYGIELTAFWFPGSTPQKNKESQIILDLLRRHKITTQLWVSMGDPAPKSQQAEKVEAGAAVIRAIAEEAAKIGCTVALYNHGGWYGEPENQIAIIQQVKLPNVGIVYNFHHGHDQMDRFPDLLKKMQPYLLAVNLNGMIEDGPKKGKMILPLGQGGRELGMLKVIQASGYSGPIGILNHRADVDAEQGLRENLEGLRGLLKQMGDDKAGQTY